LSECRVFFDDSVVVVVSVLRREFPLSWAPGNVWTALDRDFQSSDLVGALQLAWSDSADEHDRASYEDWSRLSNYFGDDIDIDATVNHADAQPACRRIRSAYARQIVFDGKHRIMVFPTSGLTDAVWIPSGANDTSIADLVRYGVGVVNA